VSVQLRVRGCMLEGADGGSDIGDLRLPLISALGVLLGGIGTHCVGINGCLMRARLDVGARDASSALEISGYSSGLLASLVAEPAGVDLDLWLPEAMALWADT